MEVLFKEQQKPSEEWEKKNQKKYDGACSLELGNTLKKSNSMKENE